MAKRQQVDPLALRVPDPVVPRPPWWKRAARRPVVWLVGVVLVGVGAQLQNTIQAYVQAALSTVGVTEPGPPIEILDVSQATGAGFDLPHGVNDQDLTTWDRSYEPTTEWLRARGAVPVDLARWEITLVGRRTEAVAVTDMKPVLTGGRCTPAIGGALIEGLPGGGPSGIITLQTAIDSPRPVLETYSGGNELQPFFAHNNLSLPAGEKNTLAVTATTAGPYCRWTIELEYLAEGGRQTMTITAPGGNPFEVTGNADPSRYKSVFLAPQRGCSSPYLRVSGGEYAKILSDGGGSCAGR